MNTQASNDTFTRRAEAIADGLYLHQIEGVAFLLGRRRSLLTDDMGLGKTRQSIVAMTEAVPQGPYLVVCPASVKRNWVREIEVFYQLEVIGADVICDCPGFTHRGVVAMFVRSRVRWRPGSRSQRVTRRLEICK